MIISLSFLCVFAVFGLLSAFIKTQKPFIKLSFISVSNLFLLTSAITALYCKTPSLNLSCLVICTFAFVLLFVGVQLYALNKYLRFLTNAEVIVNSLIAVAFILLSYTSIIINLFYGHTLLIVLVSLFIAGISLSFYAIIYKNRHKPISFDVFCTSKAVLCASLIFALCLSFAYSFFNIFNLFLMAGYLLLISSHILNCEKVTRFNIDQVCKFLGLVLIILFIIFL